MLDSDLTRHWFSSEYQRKGFLASAYKNKSSPLYLTSMNSYSLLPKACFGGIGGI